LPEAHGAGVLNQAGDCQDRIGTAGADGAISREDSPHKVADILRMAVEEKDSSRR